jgi:urea transport system ATP-binding protein
VVEAMLEMVGVTAGYGRSMVLFDVDLSVPKGGAAAIMGHNGAGKTTLLRVAVGLIPVKSGTVLLNGEDVTGCVPIAGSATDSATSPRASSASRR